MKRNHILATLFLAALFTGRSHAAAITLQLDPSNGALIGQAGETVGWGFTLSNSGLGFLLVTDTSFEPTPLSAFGFYTDLLTPQITAGPNFLVIGPAPETPSLTESFNAALQTGIGEFTLAPTAAGQVTGRLVVHYSLFSESPNDPGFDPDLDTVLAEGRVSAPASINPEPGALVLFATASLTLAVIRKRIHTR